MNKLQVLDLNQWVELFLSTKTKRTASCYRGAFERVGTLDYINILDYLDALEGNTYYNNQLSIFKSFFKFLYTNNLINVNPIRDISYRPDDSTSYKPITPLTIKALTKIKRDQLTPYILMALNTGLRASELLDVPNCRLDGNVLHITTKGRVKRKLMLNKAARSAYKSIMLNPIIITPRGFRLRFTRYCIRWGLERFSCHQLRATFATTLYQSGTTLESIRLLLGHSSTYTTERYIKSVLKSDLIELPEDIYNVYEVA